MAGNAGNAFGGLWVVWMDFLEHTFASMAKHGMAHTDTPNPNTRL